MDDIIASVKSAKEASVILASIGTDIKNAALKAMAEAMDTDRDRILRANASDIRDARSLFDTEEIGPAAMDRLKITDEKISGMIAGVTDVIKLSDPVGETLSAMELDDGLILYQVSCPIGVIGVIFESRPDVVPQIMSLCLKSGNAVIFKGGKEAASSNRVLFDILIEAASSQGIPREAFVLMESREEVNAILEMDGHIDLIIPRGSNSFVRYIQENTKIPVLGHAAGICHVYVDGSADMTKALNVTLDSKVQYPAVCNAAETLIVDSSISKEFLPEMSKLLSERGVEMRVDERAFPFVSGNAVRAKDTDWDEEYNANILSIKTVDSADEAIEFINKHGSGHTDAIVAEDKVAIGKFVSKVDSAGVFVNASTRFSDGYRYGKGAEIGVSTNKIHARGPVGMEGLMIYKYILVGNGNTVKDYVGRDAKPYKHKKVHKEFKI